MVLEVRTRDNLTIPLVPFVKSQYSVLEDVSFATRHLISKHLILGI